MHRDICFHRHVALHSDVGLDRDVCRMIRNIGQNRHIPQLVLDLHLPSCEARHQLDDMNLRGVDDGLPRRDVGKQGVVRRGESLLF